MIQSLAVEWLDEFYHILLALILDLLLLHPQVVVILEVCVHDYLVQMADYADMSIGLDIVVCPLLQLTLSNIYLRFVHYLHKQTMVLIKTVEFSILCIFDQLEDIFTLLDNLFFFLSGHIGAQNLTNDLTVKNLLEFVDRILMFRAIF